MEIAFLSDVWQANVLPGWGDALELSLPQQLVSLLCKRLWGTVCILSRWGLTNLLPQLPIQDWHIARENKHVKLNTLWGVAERDLGCNLFEKHLFEQNFAGSVNLYPKMKLLLWRLL